MCYYNCVIRYSVNVLYFAQTSIQEEVVFMHSEVRRQEILKMLTLQDTMRVEEIIKHFDATPATIRRDLTYLEQSGAIMRTHGAAKIVNPFPARNVIFSEEKIAIAKCAVKDISDNACIIMDAGTTTLSLASRLAGKKNLTVITNSIAIANTLAGAEDVTTIISGGVLNGKTQSLIGPDAEQFFSRYQASTAYIATTGIDRSAGLTCISPFEHSLKRAMIAAARRVVLLCDSSKFDNAGGMLFATFQDLDCIITSKPITDQALLDRLRQANVELIVAED